jgi:hypothetical protein
VPGVADAMKAAKVWKKTLRFTATGHVGYPGENV